MLALFPGMDSGLYAAYTGLLARTQALDTAANNLANAGTNGFRAHQDYFRGVVEEGLATGSDSASGAEGASQVGGAVNGFGVLGGNQLDLSQGQLSKTGNPLDLALQGSGFFAVKSANGVVYTRNGSFSRSATGVLEDAQGEPVLDVKQRPITIPSGAIQVSGDGTISVTTDGQNAIVGQVGVFDFADKTALTSEGTDRLTVAAGTTPVAANATVEQGSLEGSNEDAIQGTMQLVLVQRQAEMMQKALSVFNNDLDKTAAEDLGRV